MTHRVSIFIDGFNLYHSLNDFQKYKIYKWLNLSRLISFFLKKNEIIGDIYYFTAYAKWNVNKQNRHSQYIKVLEDFNIKVIFGEFRSVTKTCRICNNNYSTFEEKMTDVNIALKIFEDAIMDKYDKAIILSGDSDLVPAIQATKNLHPNKIIGVLFPPNRKTFTLVDFSDFHMKIGEKHLKSAILPNPYTLKDGTTISQPTSWS